MQTKAIATENFLDDLSAVIVLYQNKLEHSQSFVSLSIALRDLTAAVDLIVYDNSPTPSSPATKNLSPWRIHYIHDPTNPGVSKAYNEGFKLGKALGKRWLLLLDQDTWFPPGALAAYAQATAEAPNCALFAPMLVTDGGALLSPCAYRFRRGFVISNPGLVKTGRQTLANRSLLNSGLLISTEAFERVGGYNSNIRLDFADVDFIERYKKLFRDYVLIDVKCTQNFSGESSDRGASLRRFAFYCQGAHHSISTMLDALLLALVTLARGLKLSLRFRTGRFLSIYIRHFIYGREP